MQISDDGAGAIADSLGNAEGIGLRAVRQRIEARYGGVSSFGVTTAPGEGFAVHLVIPAAASRRTVARTTSRADRTAAVT